MLADDRLQPIASETPERRPELERAEPPAERGCVLAQADDVLVHPEVLGYEAERTAKVGRPPTEEHRAVHRREQPLVRVDADRVGPLPAGEGCAQLRAHRRRPGIRRVDVEPHALRLRPVRDRRYRIDRRRRRRADRGDDRACVTEVERVRPQARTTSSTGDARTSSSSRRAAFAVDECVCSEHTTTLRSGAAARAAASAVIRPDDAVSSIWPCIGSGRPSSWRNQSSVTSSSSCSAGDALQRMPTWLRPAIRSSARMPGSAAVVAKYAKYRGLCQCVMPGHQDLVEIAQDGGKRLRLVGWRGRQGSSHAPGSTRDSTGYSPTPSRYRATHSSAAAPSSRNVLIPGLSRSRPRSACSAPAPSSATPAAPGRSRARHSRAP